MKVDWKYILQSLFICAFKCVSMLSLKKAGYFMVALSICLLAGCKKDLNYSYAFNLNGVAEHGDNYTAVYHLDTVAALQEFAAEFYIGNSTDTNYVQLSFSGDHYITPGTYYTGITNAGNTICSFAYNKRHTYYSNVSGILEILQMDTVHHFLKGNFQFKAVNNMNSADTVFITNGGFAGMKYTIQ